VALTVSPIYPVAGATCTLTASSSVGTSFSFDVTERPDRSEVTLGRLVDESGLDVDTFVPDTPGEYGIRILEYQAFVAPPSFDGDPLEGSARLHLVGTQSGTVSVGEYVTLPLAVGADALSLALLVVGAGTAYVRAASLENPTSERARLVALDAVVGAAVSALVGSAVSSLGPSLVSSVASLCTAYDTHRALIENTTEDVVHSPAPAPYQDQGDATYGMSDVDAPYTVQEALRVLNSIREHYVGHIRGREVGGSWHAEDDGLNVPVALPAVTTLAGIVLYADLRDVLAAHVVQTASPAAHENADDVSAVPVATPLDTAIVAVLRALTGATLTQPAQENLGSVLATFTYGLTL
jgi:hypothetical protein